MNLSELNELAVWVKGELPDILQKYQAIHQAIQHNATQQQKRPLAEVFNDLTTRLEEVSGSSLNREQRRLLIAMGGNLLLKSEGVAFLKSIENKTDFDPATEAKRVQEVVADLNRLKLRVDGLLSSFEDVSVPEFAESQGNPDETVVRVEFREGAAISNVKEWRYWSNQWYDIGRGVALAAGQAPEDIRVVSAGRGSIFIDLAMGLLCARIFTGIISCVTSAAMKITQLQSARLDLKQKGIITERMEIEFDTQVADLQDQTVATVVNEVNERFPETTDGEVEVAISRSVKQLLAFQNRGGMLDFTPPPVPDESVDGLEEAGDDLNQLHDEIQALRDSQAEMLRLTANLDHPMIDDDE